VFDSCHVLLREAIAGRRNRGAPIVGLPARNQARAAAEGRTQRVDDEPHLSAEVRIAVRAAGLLLGPALGADVQGVVVEDDGLRDRRQGGDNASEEVQEPVGREDGYAARWVCPERGYAHQARCTSELPSTARCRSATPEG